MADPMTTCVTVISKLASEVLVIPSLTLIIMLLVVPISMLLGVPVSAPVLVLKLAQSGLFVILNVSV